MESTPAHKKHASLKKESSSGLTLSSNLFPVVGIGASAGGLDAFKKLIKAIPENSGMAFVLVQHLDPAHQSMLPEILQKTTNIPVSEITDDVKVQPNHIYIIPSNKMMVANDGKLELSPRPAKGKNERNLPIDLFFSSLAEVHQSHAIGVVLSGTASDGTLGLKAIKDYGGITFAQDEESAEYEGMPHSAAQAGVVDFILPPEKIPQKLIEVTRITNGNGGDEQSRSSSGPQQDENVFKQILSLLRIRKGTDFSYYKQTTIRRRILRRMALNKNEELDTYLKYLRENKTEQDVLYQDLLIPVTSFFRDTKPFDNLCESVFPLIVKNKTAGEPIRVWVAGCSTGQEAYSIAICLKEFIGDNGSSVAEGKVQIFATDISEPAIVKARAGLYTKSEINDLTPPRLQEFFTKTNGSYQVNKQVRDMCVFAAHNFLKDPPFGKMDLISCRNVLIYMEPYLQKKALTTFHYALNPKGFLLLGKSETISGVPDLFATAGKHDKLFNRKDAPGRFMLTASQRSEQNFADMNASPKSDPEKSGRTDFQKTADDIMLSNYTPAGVVVNEAMDIVHFRGKTGNYLEQSPGKPSHNLLQMAKNGLAFELRNILHKAKKDKAPVIKENIPVQVNGSLRNISIEALALPDIIEPHYLILFHDNPQTSNTKSSSKLNKDDKYLLIQQLEQELAQAREDMRSISEDQETVNEELQSANEELLSGSEELQSLNEELETGKEELQSTNEELTVVNQEMVSLNEQVTAARDYADAIVATVREPLLVLDKNLRVKTANKSFYKTFQVNEHETEGKLIYDLGNKQWNIPPLRTLLESLLPEKESFFDFEVEHTFPAIGQRTMLLNAREITREKGEEKLILLAIEDITEIRRSQQSLKDSEKRYNMMLMQSPFAFGVLKGKDMVITFANDSIKEVWGKGNDVEGKTLLQILPELKDQPFPALLDKVYTTGVPFYGYEMLARLQRKGKWEDVYFNLVYQPYLEADETISGVTIIAYEVTIQVTTKNKILEIQQKHGKELEEKVQQRTLELSEANESLVQKNQEIALSKYNKRFLTEFSEKFSAYKLHNEFFGSLVQFIAETTRLDYVFVGKIEQTGSGHSAIHTIALTAFGKPADNITYPLPGGPCEQVIKGNLYSYPERCRQIFPKNETIAQFKVEGYIGYPLYDEQENAVGLIAVMHEKKIEDTETVSSILKIVAKRAEIELERIKQDEQLAQHNKILAGKNTELENMNKELQAFAYVSSHDLQEPLRKMQTFAGRILEKESQKLSDTGKANFRRIQEAAKRMQTLIQDLLDFSRVNTAERKFESTDLNKIIEDVKNEFKETIEEKRATIETGEACEASIIPFQFRQLVHNLIGNSLKFSHPERPPHIIIKSEKVKGGTLKKASLSPQTNYCHITFTDNGIGFEPEFKDKIFEIFQQLHTKEEYAGTGIGLAIVKKIVEHHNGIITATSQLNKGATFDIYIPSN